jgi:hypothetical protein
MERFQTTDDDPRFDVAMQERIITRAAELQKEQANSLSRTDLELAAAEAGIDPQFVRAAIRDLGKEKRAPWDGAIMPHLALTAFALAAWNIYLATRVLSPYLVWDYSTAILVVVGIAFGVLLSANRLSRAAGLGIPVLSILSVLAAVSLRGVFGSIADVRFENGCYLLVVQILSVGFGILAGMAWHRTRKERRPNPDVTSA